MVGILLFLLVNRSVPQPSRRLRWLVAGACALVHVGGGCAWNPQQPPTPALAAPVKVAEAPPAEATKQPERPEATTALPPSERTEPNDPGLRLVGFDNIRLAEAHQTPDDPELPEPISPARSLPRPSSNPAADAPPDAFKDAAIAPVSVADVIASVHNTFPLLEAAYQEAAIASGKQLAAWGAFDTKLKSSSESGPLGYYETHRHQTGALQPLYGGGELYSGYRLGRGSFQPWYKERQTNDGGEFKAGLRVPLWRDRRIDARRAELWRATYDRQRAQPEIRSQLILFVRDGAIAYWKWVAAGQQYLIGQRALGLAQQRNRQLERKVELGDEPMPVLQDNLRAIAKRQAKLLDLRRKLQQSAVKLSLFLRTDDGVPHVPTMDQLPDFPKPTPIDGSLEQSDIQLAVQSRPEIAALDAMIRKVNIDLAEAQNNMLPAVDAQVIGSQDVGQPTSSKRDKSEFELEAGVFVDLPLQRRKAQGKSQAARGKLVQLSAKRRFTVDKIAAEVQGAYAALAAAYERLDQARESQRLSEYIATVERKKFDAGESGLLSVALREQYAVEAADSVVEALFEYFAATADYHAALARDRPTGQPGPR